MLIMISVTPMNMPKLYSYYVMNDKIFIKKYLHLFNADKTIFISNNDPDYRFEIYLPDCKIASTKDIHKINNFRELFNSNYSGNIDILSSIDYKKNKRVKYTSDSEGDNDSDTIDIMS